MQFGIISIFPEMFQALTEQGVTGRAVNKGLVSFDVWNPRDFTTDKHRTVDDRTSHIGKRCVACTRNVAHESSGESISSACRIDDFFKW